MRPIIHKAMLFIALAGTGGLAWSQQRPLQTEDAATLPLGSMRVQVGTEFLQGQTFRLSGLKGDLFRHGVMGVFIGVGSAVEFQMEGTLLNSLHIAERIPAFSSPELEVSGDTTRSVGDLVLGTKMRLVKERLGMPAIAFRFAVELPNAGNQKGLSNDETNFYASLLAAKQIGRLRGMASLGMAILGDPTATSSQDDLLTYGLGGFYRLHRQVDLAAEVCGRTGPGGPGTDDQSHVRLGLRIHAGNLSIDAAAVNGLTRDDGKAGFTFGLSYQFSLFHP